MTKAQANEAFVRAFQAANGLRVDGWAGADTLAAFNAEEPKGAEPIDDNDALLIKELERDEGRVRHAYQDSLGFWTIGIGRLIDRRRGGGLSNEEIDYLKRNDIQRIKGELDKALPWWRSASLGRQRAIQNLAFNLGTPGLVEKWPNTVAKMKAGDWQGAAQAVRTNKVWVNQVKDRAERVAKLLEGSVK